MSVSEEERKIMKTIGIQLGKRRGQLNMSQNDVANILSIDRANYTKSENGNPERKLQFSQLAMLSQKLDVSLDFIFGLTDETSKDIDIKRIYKKYGLTEQSLIEIKRASEYTKDSLNYFMENFGLTFLSLKITDYKNISEIYNRLYFITLIGTLSKYIIDKLKANEKNKIRNFMDYCISNNEIIMNLSLDYDVDYRNIYQNFKNLYDLMLLDNIKITKKKENEILNILNNINNEYYKFLYKIANLLKITRLELIEKMQYFLEEIKVTNQMEVGSEKFKKLFGENEKELEKYLGDGYIQNKKHFKYKTNYIPFL